MTMTARQIRNWEVRTLRNMWHTAKMMKCGQEVLDGIDLKIVELEAKPERERMKNIHQVMSNSSQRYDKV